LGWLLVLASAKDISTIKYQLVGEEQPVSPLLFNVLRKQVLVIHSDADVCVLASLE
jgi:hypothetical protein